MRRLNILGTEEAKMKNLFWTILISLTVMSCYEPKGPKPAPGPIAKPTLAVCDKAFADIFEYSYVESQESAAQVAQACYVSLMVREMVPAERDK